MRILAGFLLIYAVLEVSASRLGSLRGEFGMLICGLVLGAALAVEWVFFRLPPPRALRDLGLGRLAGRSPSPRP